MPRLEERREDSSLLVNHFLHQFNAKNDLAVTIEPAAVQRLEEMPWPGNVRELENTVNRLAIFASTRQIASEDVESEAQRPAEILVAHPAAPRAPDRLVST